MDDFIIILICSICLGAVIYFFFDDESEEEVMLLDRLSRLSKKQKIKDEGKVKTNSLEVFMSLYIEPIIINWTKNKKSDTPSKLDIRQMLMESGKPYSNDDILRFKAVMFICGLVAFCVCSFVGLLLLAIKVKFIMVLMLTIALTIFSTFFPVLMLNMTIKNRREEIRRSLPDTLDLLVVCVEAGLGLDAALTRVSVEQTRTSPILAKEIGRVSKDVLAGIPRIDAFRNLAIRNNIPDLKALVALLVQTDKLGTSISQSLRVYSDSVRTKRRQRAEEAAAKASIKMIFPLVICILPAIFVVIIMPAVINLIKQFAGTR